MPDITLRPHRFLKIPAGRIDPHPDNFRVHTDHQQSTLTAGLDELGFVGAIIVRPHGKDKQGERYQCLDGHERLTRFKKSEKVPCLVVKLTDEEAAKFLATYDTITGLAETDLAALERLTAGLEWNHAELDSLVADTLADASALVDEALEDLDETEDEAADTFDAEETPPPTLPSGERNPIQTMTFTLHDEQVEIVKEAVQAAKAAGPFGDTGNANNNGNALARIAEAYRG